MNFKQMAGLFCGLMIMAFATVHCAAPQYQAPEGKYAATQGNDQFDLILNRGHFRLEERDRNLILEDGSYRVNGNQIQFLVTMATAEDICDSSQRDFTYTWSFDGKALTLASVQDPCTRRVELLGGQSWDYRGTPE